MEYLNEKISQDAPYHWIGQSSWLPGHSIIPCRYDVARPCRMTWERFNSIIISRFMYYVYFLAMKDSHIYTGSTKDLKKRFLEHERGNVTTTSKNLPVKIIGYEAYSLKSDAQRRERFLKTTEGKRLFRQQYRDVLTISQDSSVG